MKEAPVVKRVFISPKTAAAEYDISISLARRMIHEMHALPRYKKDVKVGTRLLRVSEAAFHEYFTSYEFA